MTNRVAIIADTFTHMMPALLLVERAKARFCSINKSLSS